VCSYQPAFLTCRASALADDDPSYIRVLDRLGLSIATVPPPQLQRSAAQTDAADVDDHGDGLPDLTHPRSQWLRDSLRDPEEDFKAIAKVGDISHGVSADDEYAGQTHAHAALARLCKTHVELDRNEAMREVCGPALAPASPAYQWAICNCDARLASLLPFCLLGVQHMAFTQQQTRSCCLYTRNAVHRLSTRH